MALYAFFLFPKIKGTLKGRRLTSIDDIKSALLEELNGYPEDRIGRSAGIDYFIGDNINVDKLMYFLN